VQSREKGREAICESTGSYISIVLLGRVREGRCNSSVRGIGRVKGGGRASPPDGAKLFLQSSKFGLTLSECLPPSFGSGAGLLAGKGMGDSNSDEGRGTVVL
jgi:hypothetical protein